MNLTRLSNALAFVTGSLSVSIALAVDTENVETIDVLGIRGANVPSTMPALRDGMIFEGKKTTVVDLTEQPNFVEPNLRQMFSKMPGLFVSDQQIPSIYNVNYRGLGNPHESEFIGFFQNNVPLAADLFGYPTMYYMPAAQRVERIEFVRGGGGLLYGPQIGPAVNFITRKADASAETSFRTDQSGGSNGLYSTYNEIRGSKGEFGFMSSFDRRTADGPRLNEDYEVNSGYFGVSYEGFDQIRLGFDVDLYQSDSGEAGRLSSEEFSADRDQTKSPFNRVEIDQVMATFTYEQQISEQATLDGRLWYSGMDRLSRRSGMFTDPANEPSTTAIDEQKFENLGYDIRYAQTWGQNHVLTLGSTGYLGDSPRTRHVSDDIRSSAQNPSDLAFDQERAITYNAIFVENLFRFGKLSVSPSMRYERINYDMRELLTNASLRRDGIDLDRTFNKALFGLGLMYQTSDRTELYANVSESYRPQRFDDLINPASELAGTNGPGVSSAVNYEVGFRGQPISNLIFDISLFRIDFDDKIEQIQVNISDVERINSGDSRHQGVELSLEYDFLKSESSSFSLFANGSFLDTEIVNSVNTNLIGNETAFAPGHVVRTGFIYDDVFWRASLTATLVGDQYWQDSNLSRGTAFGVVDAEIPSYEVLDFSMEYNPNEQWSIYGGINNLLNEDYFSRIRNDGIEPALERTFYIGMRLNFRQS